MGNAKEFSMQLRKAFAKKVLPEFNRRKKLVAEETLETLISLSPYLTGSYITSHKIGINARPIGFDTFIIGMLSHDAAAAKARNAGLLAIATATAKDAIIIANNTPYAPDIEFFGWATRSPYHVYGLTIEYMRHRAKQIMEGGA